MNESFEKETRGIIVKINQLLESGCENFVQYLDEINNKYSIEAQSYPENSGICL